MDKSSEKLNTYISQFQEDVLTSLDFTQQKLNDETLFNLFDKFLKKNDHDLAGKPLSERDAKSLKTARDNTKILNELLLSAKDPKIDIYKRIDAAKEIAKMSGQENIAAKSLLAIAQDCGADGFARIEAAEEIAKMSGQEKTAIEAFVAVAQDPEDCLLSFKDAAEEIAKMSGQENTAAQAFLAIAKDPKAYFMIRLEAAQEIAKMSGQENTALEALLTIAQDPKADSGYRLEAAQGIAKMSGQENTALKLFLAIAQGPKADSGYRLAAAQGIAKMDGQEEAALKLFLTIAKDPKADSDYRVKAAQGIANMSGQENTALEALLAIAKDPEADTFSRIKVAEEIADMDGQEEAALEAYLAIAKDPRVSSVDRLMLAEIIANIDEQGNTALEGYLAIAKDPKAFSDYRVKAAQGIAKMDGQEEAALEAFLAIAKDPEADSYDRVKAAQAIANIPGQEKVLDILIDNTLKIMRQDLPLDQDIMKNVRAEILNAASFLFKWMGDDSNEGLEAFILLTTLSDQDDSAFGLSRTLIDKSKEDATLTLNPSTISSGENQIIASFTEETLKYQSFDWMTSYSDITWETTEAKIIYYIDVINSINEKIGATNIDPKEYIEAINKKTYIKDKINIIEEPLIKNELINKTKFIISKTLKKIDKELEALNDINSKTHSSDEVRAIAEEAGNILSDLYIFNYNIQSCTGGDQEAITVTAQRVSESGTSNSSDEVLLKEKLDNLFLRIRTSMLLGYEAEELGLSKEESFSTRLNLENTHEHLAAENIVGDLLGLRGKESPLRYDMHIASARDFVQSTSKQEIADAFTNAYTLDRMLPVIIDEVNKVFLSENSVTDTDGRKHFIIKNKWIEIMQTAMGDEFKFDYTAESSTCYKTVTYDDGFGDQYQAPIGLSPLGVVKLLENLGYARIEK